MNPAPAQTKQIDSIQVLRALAAILVVIFHAQTYARVWASAHSISPPLLDGFFSFREFGAIGVDLFFIISGFIMTVVTWNQFGNAQNIIPFVKKRFVRLVPTYWFYTLITALLAYCFVSFMPEGEITIKKVVYSLFFLPVENSGGGKSHVLVVAWTLVYEIFFYLCVCFCIPFSRKYFLPLVLLMFLGAAVVLPNLIPVLLHRPFSFMRNASLLIEFIYGIGIGILYRNKFNLSRGGSRLSITLGLFTMLAWIIHPFPIDRAIAWGIPCALVFFGVVLQRAGETLSRKWAPLIQLGDSSYSLYLIHIPLFQLLLMILNGFADHSHFTLAADAFMVLFAALAILTSHAVYVAIEKRLMLKFF